MTCSVKPSPSTAQQQQKKHTQHTFGENGQANRSADLMYGKVRELVSMRSKPDFLEEFFNSVNGINIGKRMSAEDGLSTIARQPNETYSNL